MTGNFRVGDRVTLAPDALATTDAHEHMIGHPGTLVYLSPHLGPDNSQSARIAFDWSPDCPCDHYDWGGECTDATYEHNPAEGWWIPRRHVIPLRTIQDTHHDW